MNLVGYTPQQLLDLETRLAPLRDFPEVSWLFRSVIIHIAAIRLQVINGVPRRGVRLCHKESLSCMFSLNGICWRASIIPSELNCEIERIDAGKSPCTGDFMYLQDEEDSYSEWDDGDENENFI